MSTAAKWIVGIIIGLLVLAALAVFGLLIFLRFNGANGLLGFHAVRPFEGRVYPIQPFNRLPTHRFGGLLPFGFFLGRLIFPVFFILIVLGGIILLFGLLRARRPAIASRMNAAPMTSTAPGQSQSRACPNCERAVQDDWNHCPYCGTELNENG